MAPGLWLNYHRRRLRPRGPICNAARTGRTVISARSESRTPSPRPLALPSARRLSHALWYGRSVRAQLLIVFVLIDVIAALVAGAVTILKARTATGVEMAASMELARLLIGEAVGLIQQEVPAERFLTDLSSQLRLVRHVRIGVKDAAGTRWRFGRGCAPQRRPRAAPRWFEALTAPSVESQSVPVIVNGQHIGTVEIVPEPRDEIAEVWENTVALGWVALLVNVAVIAHAVRAVRARARPAHRGGERPRRSGAPQTTRCGCCGHRHANSPRSPIASTRSPRRLRPHARRTSG